MSGFVLRHMVRDILADSDTADPGALADLVLAAIPRNQVRAALAQTLRLYVRQVISEERIGNAPSNVSPIKPSPSSKVAAIREGWQRRLDDRLHVGDSQWKLLRDCTADDLDAVAAERRLLADKNAAWARTYSEWARRVREADVETFGALPVETLMQTLGATA